jgi:hypothetical protein
MSLSILAAQLVLSLFVPTVDTPAELVIRLGGEDPVAATTALLALDPAESLPPLVECLASASPDHAWRAGRVVRELTQAWPRSRAWKKTASAMVEIVTGRKYRPENRTITALFLANLGSHAKSGAADLAGVLDSDAPSTVRMGAALALAGIGKDAVKHLGDNLEGEGMMRMVWTGIALAGMGEAGKGLKKTLVRLVENEGSLTAFLACRVNLFALEEVAGKRAVVKPLEKRRDFSKGRIERSTRKGLNFVNNSIQRRPVAVLESVTMFRGSEPVNPATISLPETLDSPLDSGGFSLGDGVQCYAEHLAFEVIRLQGRLLKDEFESWEAWSESVETIVNLAEFLTWFDMRVMI